jgi:hypothetical protein
VESITATNTLVGTRSLTSGSHFSLIDSTVSHMWLPRDICDAFEEAFGLTYDSSTDLYLINSTMRDQVEARNPSVTIKLINSLEDTSKNYTNIVLPYSAFDLQASYPFYDNATNYFPIRRAENDTQYTLGRTLLQEAYLIVDYERATFTVQQAVFPNPLPAANIITITSPNDSGSEEDSSGLSTGAIAGIAIGSVLAVLIAAVAGFFLWRRRRRGAGQNPQNQKYELANNQANDSTSRMAVSPAPHKADFYTQELSGTPLTELASPRPDPHSKFYPSVNQEPQELPLTMPAPRWQEVSANQYFEMDNDSARSREASQRGDRTPTSEGHYTGVSAMSGRQ